MSAVRLLFSTGSLYVFDTAHCFELAAEAGFDGMEIMCDYRYGTRSPAYLQSLSQCYDLPVLVAHTPFGPPLPGWENGDEASRILQTVRLAETLGCEAIVVHLPPKIGIKRIQVGARKLFLPWGSSKRIKAWFEHDLPRVQAQTSVKIAIENMPVYYVFGRPVDAIWRNEPETWAQVHEHLTLDTTHWATKGVDPLDAYAAANGRVSHVHLSNYANEREHQLPQRGDLDLAAFLRGLAADGYAGTLTVELHPYVLEFENDAALRRNMRDCVAFCREHL